jgi:hypothetical protein
MVVNPFLIIGYEAENLACEPKSAKADAGQSLVASRFVLEVVLDDLLRLSVRFATRQESGGRQCSTQAPATPCLPFATSCLHFRNNRFLSKRKQAGGMRSDLIVIAERGWLVAAMLS